MYPLNFLAFIFNTKAYLPTTSCTDKLSTNIDVVLTKQFRKGPKSLKINKMFAFDNQVEGPINVSFVSKDQKCERQ